MTDLKYWVWYSLVIEPGTRNDGILAAFPDPKELYEATENEILVTGAFTRRQLEKTSEIPLKKAEVIVETCEKNGWKIITPESEEYPEDLKRLTDMPLVLYVDGDLSCVNKGVAIGVVGTRKPGPDSVEVTTKISAQMAAAGAVIISGGALGIDSAAHEGALLANGKTVCVLGCGLGTNYLMENEPLRKRIRSNGAIVSEYPPFMRASIYTFPKRNRVISGMSKGLLVVEAGEKSGSLITARCAESQGRMVYAIPGRMLSSAYTGSNRLISQGAKPISCSEDILNSYAVMYPDIINMKNLENIPDDFKLIPDTKEEEKTAKRPRKKKAVQTQEQKEEAPRVRRELDFEASERVKKIYSLIESTPLHPDEISLMSGLPVSAVLASLIKLEMNGFIEQTDGKSYVLK